MSQRELFDVAEVGERKVLPSAARASSRSKATPAPVGTGPVGETCRTCAHYTRVVHNDYSYPKCGLMQADWTRGPGSDIKASYDACRLFEPRTTGPDNQPTKE
ncbi:MAG: hypothetical protein IT428_26310 [Planctomycetaceae bacterium]|nr:hypothetical protein [Planctomycetaceae bacterium]